VVAFVLALVIVRIVIGGGSRSFSNAAATPITSTPVAGAPTAAITPAGSAPTPAPGGADLASSPSSATPTTTPPPIVLTGTGRSTASFNAAGGLTVLATAYDGSDNFAVVIVSGSGQSVDLAVDVVGTYHGTVSAGLNPGRYTLIIAASGPWNITITQPRNQQDFHLPYVFNNGHGDALIGPFRVDGAYRITATNRGQGDFIVNVLNSAGQSLAIPVNKVGDYSGSAGEGDVTPGSDYLQVNSDGAWTITVSSV